MLLSSTKIQINFISRSLFGLLTLYLMEIHSANKLLNHKNLRTSLSSPLNMTMPKLNLGKVDKLRSVNLLNSRLFSKNN